MNKFNMESFLSELKNAENDEVDYNSISKLYNEIAKYYDTCFENKNFRNEAFFINNLFKSYSKIEINKILDAGCGTCNHLINLAKLGYKTVGIEISKDMLMCAQKKIYNENLNIKLVHDNILEFKTNERFDGIICMFSTFNHFFTDKDISQLLRKFNNLLVPSGCCIIDMMDMFYFFKEYLSGIKKKIIKRGKCQIIITQTAKYSPKNQIAFINKNYLITESKSSPIFITDKYKLRIYSPIEITLFLKYAGFDVLEIYGDYSMKSDKIWRTIPIAIKR